MSEGLYSTCREPTATRSSNPDEIHRGGRITAPLSQKKTIGIVQVTEALDKFSKAKVVSGETPGKGQIARILKDKTGIGSNNVQQQRQKIGRKI